MRLSDGDPSGAKGEMLERMDVGVNSAVFT